MNLAKARVHSYVVHAIGLSVGYVKREDWLTIYEIAEATKFDPATVRQWIESGALEAFRLGHRSYRIPRAAWERFLEDRRVRPQECRV